MYATEESNPAMDLENPDNEEMNDVNFEEHFRTGSHSVMRDSERRSSR